jgi:hypothetical protein
MFSDQELQWLNEPPEFWERTREWWWINSMVTDDPQDYCENWKYDWNYNWFSEAVRDALVWDWLILAQWDNTKQNGGWNESELILVPRKISLIIFGKSTKAIVSAVSLLILD